MIKISDLSVAQRIGLELLWGFACLIAILPYWVRFYVLEPIIFFVLCDLLHYRRKIVMENLRNSFPERDERELRRIARGFYHNLAEVFIGTFNLAHKPLRKMRRYMHTEDLSEVNRAIGDQDVVVLLAHHGLWELGIFWNCVEPQHVTLGIYHQLRSKVLDLFYQRLRTSPNSVPVMKKESMRFYLTHRAKGIDGRRMTLGLIADQNPPLRPDAHWFRFLNQDTVFFDGGEQLALRYGLPVWFAEFERVGRGRYRILMELIYDGKEAVEPHEITERYVRRLEQMIQKRPDLWMWSHRRWKHKRTKYDAV